ncbi:hypothetical protein ACJ6WD_40985 [Streptomyces sp. VTCC 41912]
MSTQHITVTTTSGETTQTTTTDPAVAREYENLPFEADHIASVTVTVTDD